jgi:hypothetical protein
VRADGAQVWDNHLLRQWQGAARQWGGNGQALLSKLLASGKGHQELLRSKLLLVGSGGAGKTSLKGRLKGEKFVEGQASTCGIQVDVETWGSTGSLHACLSLFTTCAVMVVDALSLSAGAGAASCSPRTWLPGLGGAKGHSLIGCCWCGHRGMG